MNVATTGGVAMKIIRFATLAALAALSACGQTPMDKAKAANDPAKFSFDAAVTVSPAALAKLKGANDLIVVTAHYYGFPAKGAESQANTLGQVMLGDSKAYMRLDSTQVRVTGEGFKATSLPHVAEGTVYVLLSTSSLSPSGFGDQLIDCNYFRGTVAKAQAAPVAVTCDLATAP